MSQVHSCRHCSSPLSHEVINLGHQPPSNAYLSEAMLDNPEITYPLRVYVCTSCWLVQVPAYASCGQLFTKDYAYFSSTSSSWLAHSKTFVDDIVNRLQLNSSSFVVELASNDGYLLQYILEKNIPCLGIEPTHATAQASISKGIPTLERFFDSGLAAQLESADLVIANNVLAHVPDINDFIKGISLLLKPSGIASIEFPHLLQLLKFNQFDTIYHEHYSYLSLNIVKRIASCFELEVVNVEQLPTHGGSLRVFLGRSGFHQISKSVFHVLDLESSFGLETLLAYSNFESKSIAIKNCFYSTLLKMYDKREVILGFGAAAKGNTLINFAGVKPDLLPMVADSAKSKQGKFLPGSHIPIVKPEVMLSQRPSYIIVFPWNILSEVQSQIKVPGSKLITFVPSLQYLDPLD